MKKEEERVLNVESNIFECVERDLNIGLDEERNKMFELQKVRM